MASNMYCIITICYALISISNCNLVAEDSEYLMFPPNFLLGASSSAYQIEGAWNASDKGESVWDRFVHDGNNRVYKNQTGDVACDSYHKFREDVAILKDLGLKAYRFSVSWPRVLPTGFSNRISDAGIAYYKNLVNELLENGIEPLVTLYHWDHPQVIEDAGGWTNPNIIEWFGDYARVIFRELGDKVKKFITVNEPSAYCINSYSLGQHAPGKRSLRGIGEYLCGENILKAHAKAYRIYEREFKPTQNGSVGIVVDVQNYYPKYPNDTESAEIAFQFAIGWMTHPIYSETGDYPKIMKEIVAKKSYEQGYPRSRLPTLDSQWVDYIKGTSDFLGVNHYTSRLVETGSMGTEPSIANDQGIIKTVDPSWPATISAWLKIVPKGFRDVLRKLSTEYNNPEIYITENGVSDAGEILDAHRIQYYRDYLKEMFLAINEDGVNVKGYLLWSFVDNFEWEQGYREHFGIVSVNFTDPMRTRTLKTSAHWWKTIIEQGKLTL